MKKLMCLVIALFSYNAHACSLAPSTEKFVITQTQQNTVPEQPSFSLSKLERGKKALHSCSGLASLTLVHKSPIPTEQGYIFEISKGTFKKIYFSQDPITTTKYIQKKEEFLFSYYEITNEPIDFTLKITAVSKSGLKSQPQFLRITDKQAKKSIFPSWSQRS